MDSSTIEPKASVVSDLCHNCAMIHPDAINLPDFLCDWYGLPIMAAQPLPANCSWLPGPLREWHALSSQWDAPLVTVKRMIAPEEIQAEGRFATFMEDQGGQIWAFDTENPMVVYEGQYREGWRKAKERLPEFLIHNALHEAAHSAEHWRSSGGFEDAHLSAVLAPMAEVAFGGWGWPGPGHRVFLGEGLVADVGPAMEESAPWGERSGYVEIQIGAKSPELLEYLDEIADIEWFRPYIT